MSNRTPYPQPRRTAPRRRTAERPSPAARADIEGGWSRSRLLGALVAAAVTVALLLGGLGYTLAQTLDASGDTAGPASNGGRDSSSRDSSSSSGIRGPGGDERAMDSDVARGAARRDEIAAAPMVEVPASAANPTEDKPTVEPDPMAIPSGVVPGPAAVLTGYPRTPQGAVGQLAAIETTVLQTMSLAGANDVYDAWALPGGAGWQAWALTTGVRAFLAGADMTNTKDQAVTVSIEPAGAMVKGTDGPDWTLACALVTVTASFKQEVQIGYGHCERMQWVGGRWMIASGTQPTTAPSTWPGSPAAAKAGWLTWTIDNSRTDTTADTAAGDAAGGGAGDGAGYGPGGF